MPQDAWKPDGRGRVDRSSRTSAPGPRRASHRGNRAARGRRVVLLVVLLGLAVAGLTVALPSSAQTVSPLQDQDSGRARLDPDDRTVELGLRFRVRSGGRLESVRFLKAAGDVDRRPVTVWGPAGQVLARAWTSGESASGWQGVRLAAPLELRTGTEYVVSYRAHRYVATQHFFRRELRAGPFVVPARGGVYTYGQGRPGTNWRASNYWIDPVMAPASTAPPSPGGTTTPTSPSAPQSGTPVPPPAAAAVLDLPRVPWAGGPAYYARFARAKAAGWTDPSFFPISVFLGKPSQAAALKAVGVNTYLAVEDGGETLRAATSQGMSVIAQGDEWTQQEIGDDDRVVGYFVLDECDMGLGGCPGTGDQANLAHQRALADSLRARKDGRFLQANFGNGVLGTFWADGTFAAMVAGMDVTSVDKYAYTSAHNRSLLQRSPQWPAGGRPGTSAAYGWLQDEMERYAAVGGGSAKPNWVFVETGSPLLDEGPDAATIRPEQIEGAVWSSLIHGAQGVAYFQNSDSSVCGYYSLVQCDAARTARLTAVNAQVTRLAPVLNSQSWAWDFRADADTMLKTYGPDAYVFAGLGLTSAPGSRTFTLPPGVRGSTVTVVDENRTLPVTGGRFTDSFADEFTHHIYRVRVNG
jgi:hypothetical protein